MSQFAKFMKKNKVVKENIFYGATKSLVDEDGQPLQWELRHLSTKENDALRESCTIEVQVKGKPGLYRSKTNTTKYIAKMVCASVVYPNLNDKELQDSYGVMTAEELLHEIVDDPGENANLTQFVQQMNGFTSLEEEVDKIKN